MDNSRKQYNKKTKVFCAALIVSIVAIFPTAAIATDCEGARQDCYKKWYIPDWGCDNLADSCNAK
jgi:hypothetical protein